MGIRRSPLQVQEGQGKTVSRYASVRIKRYRRGRQAGVISEEWRRIEQRRSHWGRSEKHNGHICWKQ